jgi:crotonobetainyl-CoA:carnitine CoA-transferase CaiB-like acyl-CoA transferase
MAAPPLEGIRVLEVANWLAGPSCAALLADLGATVVKVEPPRGDPYRHLLMSTVGYDFDFGSCPGFELDNRGKRSIALDLEQPSAREVLLKLAVSSDILVTNLVPERREKYGISFEAVQAANPRAIYASVTGFGSEGPDANRPGWDHTGFWARSGIMGLMAEPGSPPASCRGGMGDHPTGLNLLAAILVALRLRDQTGEGQFVDVSLQQTGMWALGLDMQSALISRQDPARKTRKEASNPLTSPYLCRDGRWIFLLMPTADYWPRFCRALERNAWLDDERLQSPEARVAHTELLMPMVEERFRQKDYAEWVKVFDDARLIYSPVPRLTEVIEDPQARAMGVFTAVDHPRLGRYETLDTPFNIRGADIGVRGRSPGIGEHTASVLEDLGLDPAQVAEYAAAGAFG